VREPGAPLRVLLVEDPEKVAWAHELQQRNPPDEDAPRGLPEVLRSGRSGFYPEVPDTMLVAAARDSRAPPVHAPDEVPVSRLLGEVRPGRRGPPSGDEGASKA
jgi:hypothetical protein